MGKKQHSKDRMFITTTEWATEWGGAKNRDLRTPFRRLPFYCCAVSFTPFEDPVCTPEGHVFDILNIVPYIQKFSKNPVTGRPLAIADLIKLHFHKNADGEYQCPVLNKVFTEFSHIVAIKSTGNVFSYEAVRELNLKPKNWKDLLSDAPFSKDEIITIQDPNNLEAKVLSDFDHVKNDIEVEDEELQKARDDPTYNMNLAPDAKRMLKDLADNKGKEELMLGGGGGKARGERAAAIAALEAAKKRAAERAEKGLPEDLPKEKAPAMSIVDAASAAVHGRSAKAAKETVKEKTHALVAAHAAGERSLIETNTKLVRSQYTSGKASRSFTSTVFTPVTVNEFEMVRQERTPKKKGYARLQTNRGDLNLELHCDIAPRTCENFLTHAEAGYYDGTVFHRSIRNFMIQGGDPTGTGRGGESIWGKPFKDELNSKILHSERGVVSMANSGPHSNGSQFFIMYKSAPHLNYKHAVFGKVVGGLDVLSAMEKVAVDSDDRPLEEIKILKVTVFVNPYTEPDEEEEAAKKAAEVTPEEAAEKEKIGSWYSNPGENLGLVSEKKGIGKYLKRPGNAVELLQAEDKNGGDAPGKRRKEAGLNSGFGNFANW